MNQIPKQISYPTARLFSRFWRRHWPLPAAALLILLFFGKMAFSNLILARGDTFLYFYPYWQAASDALRSGRLPLWNPDLFMGAPLLANSQVGLFYPLNWPLWLLAPVPYAVSLSILLHLFIAAAGTYFAGRRSLALGRSAALLAAVLFSLGGYLTAQVEHVNQLQGLAWLPWFFVVLASCAGSGTSRRVVAKAAAGFALLFSLQLLAGHMQTTFISGTAVLMWGAGRYISHQVGSRGPNALRFAFTGRRFQRRAVPALALGGGLALLLAAVQLLPTWELSQLSSRQGGLAVNEVLSFSWHPLLAPQALMPAYGRSLFSEYVAFLPLTALILAVLGGREWRRWPGVLPALLLVAAGLLLALGSFNPLNWLLARLPLFNLFRVPARWLVLYALGTSLLAGFGWQMVLDRALLRHRRWADLPDRARENLWRLQPGLRLGELLMAFLIVAAGAALILARYVPTGPEAPFVAPTMQDIAAWTLESVLVLLLLRDQRLPILEERFGRQLRTLSGAAPQILAAACLLVLFLSSRSLPYNNLTTPEAYFDLRPSLARLKTVAECSPGEPACSPAPGRMLSLSDIFFDPGDQAEIDTIYASQLPAAARYDYTVAIKQKEVVSPNLPLAYGLTSVDGFDGGILPLRSYSQVMGLILPEGVTTTDGRLREHLQSVPAAKWMDLFNAQYLVTDKVGDVWREGVFFDLQHPALLAEGESTTVTAVPEYEATELWLVASDQPGELSLTSDGGDVWQLSPQPLAEGLYQVVLPQPALVNSISVAACTAAPCQISGLSLVDARDETFQPVTMGGYRMIHSGDVKIYQNLDVLPRAIWLSGYQWQPDVEASVAAMSQPEFDPRSTAVLVGSGVGQTAVPDSAAETAVIEYTPERVVITNESAGSGLLLLTDAYYPGWQAEIDGTPAEIYQADGMFRGVLLPAGRHQVTFTFDPASFRTGRSVTLVTLGLWLLLLLLSRDWRPLPHRLRRLYRAGGDKRSDVG